MRTAAAGAASRQGRGAPAGLREVIRMPKLSLGNDRRRAALLVPLILMLFVIVTARVPGGTADAADALRGFAIGIAIVLLFWSRRQRCEA